MLVDPNRVPKYLILRVEKPPKGFDLEGVQPEIERGGLERGKTPYRDAKSGNNRSYYYPSDVYYNAFYDLRQCPVREESTVIGEPDYHTNSIKNCEEYITYLRKLFGREPFGANFATVSQRVCAVNQSRRSYNPDVTRVYHVRLFYLKDDPSAKDYADRVVIRQPLTWKRGNRNEQ